MLTDLQLVQTYYEEQRATARRTADGVVRTWNARDRDKPYWDAWQEILPAITDAVTEGQYEAAQRAKDYVPLALEVQGAAAQHEMNPAAYLTPTVALNSGLGAAPARGVQKIAEGQPINYVDAFIAYGLKRFASTYIEDAGREAVAGQMIAEPAVKYYYRKLQLPSCNRCAILVGRPYKKENHFLRHPQCDCQTVPAVDRDPTEEFDIVEQIKEGQIKGFNKDEVDAIVNKNADVNQITNAKRNKLQRADLYGKENLRTTTVGTTKRSLAGQRLGAIDGHTKVPGQRYMISRVPRLTPREIYRQANTDKELIGMLKKYGYIL